MDGDLQHDPADIPVFLEKIAAGYDIVSGWRKVRVDNFWMRRIPSRMANWLMAKLSGVDIHDFGTTFKAYRREILEQVPLYGELHRFIPALASWYGASICEVPIRNVNRERGDLSLRYFANLPRFLRSHYDSVSAPLSFPSAALLRNLWSAQPIRRQRRRSVARLRKVSAPRSRYGLSRPVDDAGSRPAAWRIESSCHRIARGDASPPLPRTPLPRALLRRPRAALTKRRAQRLGIIPSGQRANLVYQRSLSSPKSLGNDRGV